MCLFGLFVPEYDGHMKATNHVAVQHKLLDELLPRISGKKLLDIATGTGTVARYAKEKGVYEVYAVDFCEEMIAEAQRHPEGIRFSVADANALPFPNAYFDAVTCAYGFYWFAEPQKAFSEASRVLVPEGKLVLLEEEFKPGCRPAPKFSEKGGYLEELAGLEQYTGVDSLIKEAGLAGFSLSYRIELPVDSIHTTVGMLFEKT